jgi:hypothetical protein
MEDYLSIKLSPKEVDLIFDLLNMETIYQIKENIHKIESKDELLNKIVGVFDVFMDFKDKLAYLKDDIIAAEKISENTPDKRPVVILTRNMLRLFSVLCKETTKLEMQKDIKEKFGIMGRDLIAKIDESIVSAPVPMEKFKGMKEVEIDKDEIEGLPINILNSKASA